MSKFFSNYSRESEKIPLGSLLSLYVISSHV